jgi:hypothetical protein
METTSDSDWTRAFFTRLIACLGSIAFGVTFWFFLLDASVDDWNVVDLYGISAVFLLSTSMILGHWRRKSANSDKGRRHLGLFGTVYVRTEMALTGLLLVRSATLHFMPHSAH